MTYLLGLRAKELSSLRIQDVWDFRKGEPKRVIRLLGSMTKGNKFREVFLVDEELRAMLTELIGQRLRHGDAPLIQSQKGDRFTPDTMQKMIAGCYKKSGVQASSHSGRRSFATNLIRDGADIYSVQVAMGHTSIATTQVYFTSDPNRMMDIMSNMSRSVRQKVAGV